MDRAYAKRLKISKMITQVDSQGSKLEIDLRTRYAFHQPTQEVHNGPLNLAIKTCGFTSVLTNNELKITLPAHLERCHPWLEANQTQDVKIDKKYVSNSEHYTITITHPSGVADYRVETDTTETKVTRIAIRPNTEGVIWLRQG
tara:strand:+ start:56173 stop:56604 length:432 start_codon:yes stop_codon:yes gene_type:complete